MGVDAREISVLGTGGRDMVRGDIEANSNVSGEAGERVGAVAFSTGASNRFRDMKSSEYGLEGGGLLFEGLESTGGTIGRERGGGASGGGSFVGNGEDSIMLDKAFSCAGPL